MPSGTRYRTTVKGKVYDFSPIQWGLVQRRSIKVDGWKTEQSLRGPIESGLFNLQRNKRGVSAVRTPLGGEVVKALKAKLRKKEQETK